VNGAQESGSLNPMVSDHLTIQPVNQSALRAGFPGERTTVNGSRRGRMGDAPENQTLPGGYRAVDI